MNKMRDLSVLEVVAEALMDDPATTGVEGLMIRADRVVAATRKSDKRMATATIILPDDFVLNMRPQSEPGLRDVYVLVRVPREVAEEILTEKEEG